jgi:hypothetical protein
MHCILSVVLQRVHRREFRTTSIVLIWPVRTNDCQRLSVLHSYDAIGVSAQASSWHEVAWRPDYSSLMSVLYVFSENVLVIVTKQYSVFFAYDFPNADQQIPCNWQIRRPGRWLLTK